MAWGGTLDFASTPWLTRASSTGWLRSGYAGHGVALGTYLARPPPEALMDGTLKDHAFNAAAFRCTAWSLPMDGLVSALCRLWLPDTRSLRVEFGIGGAFHAGSIHSVQVASPLLGNAPTIHASLHAVPGVKTVHFLTGPTDIILYVEAASNDALMDILGKVRA